MMDNELEGTMKAILCFGSCPCLNYLLASSFSICKSNNYCYLPVLTTLFSTKEWPNETAWLSLATSLDDRQWIRGNQEKQDYTSQIVVHNCCFNYLPVSSSSVCADPIITDKDSCESSLLLLPSEIWWLGDSHWLAWWLETSCLFTTWNVAHFASIKSFNDNRQIGQVDCLCNHTSMQERWKLWPQVGIIRRISPSWYSPKHIVHWAPSQEWKVSLLYWIVGIAATTAGPRLLIERSGVRTSECSSTSKAAAREPVERIRLQIRRMQTNRMKVELIPNPITIVTMFMLKLNILLPSLSIYILLRIFTCPPRRRRRRRPRRISSGNRNGELDSKRPFGIWE